MWTKLRDRTCRVLINNSSVSFVDVIDVVKDQLHGADYVREEDPRVYMSEKTGRGPLNENWVEEYWDECKVIVAGFMRSVVKIFIYWLTHYLGHRDYIIFLSCPYGRTT